MPSFTLFIIYLLFVFYYYTTCFPLCLSLSPFVTILLGGSEMRRRHFPFRHSFSIMLHLAIRACSWCIAAGTTPPPPSGTARPLAIHPICEPTKQSRERKRRPENVRVKSCQRLQLLCEYMPVGTSQSAGPDQAPPLKSDQLGSWWHLNN